MKKSRFIFIVFITIFIFSISTLNAQWAGAGTADDPWQISTVSELKALSTFVMNDPDNTTIASAKNSYEKYWKLMNDIDMEGVTDFIPIGGWSNPTTSRSSKIFAGFFDGNGKTIRNIFVFSTVSGDVGLFGTLEHASIKNVGIECGDFYGNRNSRAGGLAGYCRNSTIENCYVTGNLTASLLPAISGYTGGLIGTAIETIISNCYTRVSLNANAISERLGGLVGNSLRNTISNCYVHVEHFTINSKSTSQKGLFIGNSSSTTITNCYYSSPIDFIPLGDQAQNTINGLVSKTDVQLKDSSMVEYPGTANNSLNYNLSHPLPWKKDHSLLNDGFPILSWQTISSVKLMIDSIFTSKTTAIVYSKVIKGTDSIIELGLQWRLDTDTVWMNIPVDITVTGVLAFNTEIPELSDTKYQVRLYAVNSENQHFYGTINSFSTTSWEGYGTSSDPYLIHNITELCALSTFVMKDPDNSSLHFLKNSYHKHWKLMNDIDMDSVASFLPIGGWSDTSTNNTNNHFSGTFYGNHKTIRNLRFNQYSKNYVGLFGYTSYAVIKDLNIENYHFNSKNYVGGLIGYQYDGIVSNCKTEGCIIENRSQSVSYIGGLIGENESGMIENCTTIVTISSNYGANYVGGLVGKSQRGTIYNCHVESYLSLQAASYIGGFIGSNSSDTISNCSVFGSVNINTGSEYLGGFVGKSAMAIINCAADITITSGSGKQLGGFVGYLGGDGSISQCLAIGSVTANAASAKAGGFAGYSAGKISNCYSTASVEAQGTSAYVGGFIGENTNYVSYCYAAPRSFVTSTGSSSSSNGKGLFAGTTHYITNCFYANAISGYDGNGFGVIPTIVPKTEAELKNPDFIDSPSSSDNSLNYNQSSLPWKMDYIPTINEGYPILTWQIQPEAYAYSLSVTEVNRTEATLNSSVINGTASITEKGLQWKKSADYLWNTVPIVGESDTFIYHLSGLTSDIQYEMRAYACVNTNYYYGKSISFTPNSTWAGAGTPESPFLIYTDLELKALSSFVMTDPDNGSTAFAKNSYNKHWKLMNDIDLLGVTDFIPIGGWGNPTANNTNKFFAGVFDGNEKIIRNLSIDASSRQYLGLFGSAQYAVIQNLGVAQGNFNGSNLIGGLAGYSVNSTITNCYATSTTTAASGYIGGLIGSASNCTISNCYARGNLSVSGTPANIGGLVGRNTTTTITNCYAAPESITGGTSSSIYKGLFIGYYASGNIANCYASSQITTLSPTGYGTTTGITSKTVMQLKDSSMVEFPGSENNSLNYNANIPLSWKIDYLQPLNNGFPILNWQIPPPITLTIDSIFTSKYAATVNFTIIKGTDNIIEKGLQWKLNNDSIWTNIPITEIITDRISLNHEITGLTPDTKYQIRLFATNSENYYYYGGTGSFTTTAWEGYGTANSPYLIYNIADLKALSTFVMIDPDNTSTITAKNSYNKHWKLMNNINLAGITDFIPIGGWSNLTTNDATKFFAGNFEGNELEISNLVINKQDKNYIGLFGICLGSIRNLSIVGGSFTGSSYIGCLVGYNTGTVQNCYVTGQVEAKQYATYAGGLIGYNSGAVSNSYATGAISHELTTSSSFTIAIGGLIGYNSGSVIGCYATGATSVSGDLAGRYAYAGGLVGETASGSSISKCYATGSARINITASTTQGAYGSVGGLVGKASGTISSSYARSSATGTSNYSNTNFYVGGLVGDASGTISNCYARNSVSGYCGGTLYAGGFVGRMSGTITNSYASPTSFSISIGNRGLFVGYRSGTLTNCYYSNEISGYNAVGSGATTGLTGKSADQLKFTLMVAHPGSSGNSLNYNQSTPLPWKVDYIVSPLNSGYPILLWQGLIFSVTTNSPTNITQTGATLNGIATEGESPIIAKGFEWKEATAENWNIIPITESTLTYNLTELTPNTAYRVRAYAATSATTLYGDSLNFSTLPIVPPAVTTNPITDISQTSATLNGTLVAGSETITEKGFEWKETATENWNIVPVIGATLSTTISGLTLNTAHQVKAYAITESGTVYGDEIDFSTLPIVPPAVTTNPASNISQTSATLNGTLVAGSETITEKGFEWKETAADTWNILPVTEATLSITINDLTLNTPHQVKAYAITENGMVYGNVITFSTLINGIEDWEGQGITLTLVPNPAKENVKIMAPDLNNPATMTFFDIQGKILKMIHVVPIENGVEFVLNITGFSSGIYFVKVQNEHFQVIKKLIVQ